MENLPTEILKLILSYVAGEEIYFHRDDKGRVHSIIGLKDDHLFSKTFICYDEESISVHCSKNLNEDWKEDSPPIMLVDFHIFTKSKETWFCCVDVTDINTCSQEVEKFVTAYRFYYNEFSKVIKIKKDDSVIYVAQYDNEGRKLWAADSSLRIVYEYDGNRRIHRREFQGDELFQEFEYTYTPDSIGPVSMYEISDENRSQCQEHCYLSDEIEVPKYNACDGIQRNYYKEDGTHLASYYLPPQTKEGPSFLQLEQMLDAPQEMPNLYVSITDPDTSIKRIIQKENGCLGLDMTIELVDGKISQISHNPEASFKGVLLSLYEKEWWQ